MQIVYVEDFCTAAYDVVISVTCDETCSVGVSGTVVGTNAIAYGAGAGGYLNLETRFHHFCSAVVELEDTATCSGATDVAFPTGAGKCTDFRVGGFGYGRLRAGNPMGPPFVVVPTYQATALGDFSLVRDGEGLATVEESTC